MRDKIFIFCLLAAAIMGCTRDVELSSPSVSSSDAIDFSATTEDSTTKGEIITTANIDEIDVYAYYTAQNAWLDEDVSPMLYMQNQSVSRTYYETTTSWGSWLYSPIKYWPSNEADKISFFAFAPYDEIDVATDATTGKPIFTHTLSSYANENEDVLAGVKYDVTNNNGPISFNLTHALTKLLLYARTEGENPAPFENEEYSIEGISIIGLYPTRTLEIDADGNCSWSLSDDNASQEKMYVAAAQGATLKGVYDYDLDNYIDGTSTDANYTEVTAADNAIFVHPQELEENDIQLRLLVLRKYTKSSYDEATQKTIVTNEELTYQTQATYLPTSVVDEWKAGAVIALYFSFDISNLSLNDTPLTVTSQVFQWTEADVDVDMHSNIYIYSSESDIAVEGNATEGYYGEFMICTNYDYTLRVPHCREELDGAITSSRGFLFCSDDFDTDNTYDVGNLTSSGVEDYKIFVPTLLDKEDGAELEYASRTTLGVADDVTTTTATVVVDGDSSSRDIYFGSNGYAFIHDRYVDEAYGIDTYIYRLLYYDTSGTLTAFKYSTKIKETETEVEAADGTIETVVTSTTTAIDIDLSDFTDDNNTAYFKIKIADGYEFDFSVRRSTREAEGLYTSTAVGSDSSYGVNKSADDAVFILRLSVNPTHLAYGDFDDIIGVEMVSNGGGMITQLFKVLLSDSNGVITD